MGGASTLRTLVLPMAQLFSELTTPLGVEVSADLRFLPGVPRAISKITPVPGPHRDPLSHRHQERCLRVLYGERADQPQLEVLRTTLDEGGDTFPPSQDLLPPWQYSHQLSPLPCRCGAKHLWDPSQVPPCGVAVHLQESFVRLPRPEVVDEPRKQLRGVLLLDTGGVHRPLVVDSQPRLLVLSPRLFDAPSLRLQLPQGAGAPPTRRSLPVPVHREDEAVRVAVVVGLLVRLVSRALEVLVLVLLELALELVESVLVVLLALLVVLLVILLDVLRSRWGLALALALGLVLPPLHLVVEHVRHPLPRADPVQCQVHGRHALNPYCSKPQETLREKQKKAGSRRTAVVETNAGGPGSW
mmetsp:Transcript_32644/g.71326  ORF Transcript_32644/g.71326 Transcript_32644/m.71326 type:complete len:357 (+) Transcript_32644:92-1162(+)